MMQLKLALEHMAWADDRFYAHLETIPTEAWSAKLSDNDWNVAHLAFHLVASADWYCYMLGQPLRFTKEPETLAEVQCLRPVLNDFNAFLLDQADLEDGEVTYEDEGKTHTSRRAIVLTQALIHAVEHRTQAIAALTIADFDTPTMDAYSTWPYLETFTNRHPLR